ncbi:MAG: hypothetical protein KZQ79_09750, partial [Candidatus Thiodiazotropha sp. (ex Lucinoma borealis)]|nr:hypothetical protein [Candidatus Thiodiazotropha sp. (ex Lucinoma borealis)]
KGVREKIQDMKADVETILENPSYPDGMKQILQGVIANLEQDTKLLANGASLCRLSFVAESEEIINVEDVQPDIEVIEIGSVAEENQDRSFSDAASRWLNSPWDVSWNDVAGEKKH